MKDKLSLFLILCLFCGCSQPNHLKEGKYRETRFLLGTSVDIDVCRDPYPQEKIISAFEEVWSRLEEISRRMNAYDEKSDVARINHSSGEPVETPNDIFQLIKKSQDYSHLTDGAFDITVGPLIELWRESTEKNIFPSSEEIAEVRKKIGFEKIQLLSENFIQKTHPSTRIDLGGIAKGYGVDEAARILRKHGIRHFYINAGGDIYVGGRNCEKKSWRIGVRDPQKKADLIGIVNVSDQAVTTSGDYEQFFEIKGKRWSHIIDPRSGSPQKGIISATVIAPTATAADALSTALCVLDPQKGIRLIDGLGESYAAYLVVSQNPDKLESYASRNFKQFQSQE